MVFRNHQKVIHIDTILILVYIHTYWEFARRINIDFNSCAAPGTRCCVYMLEELDTTWRAWVELRILMRRANSRYVCMYTSINIVSRPVSFWNFLFCISTQRWAMVFMLFLDSQKLIHKDTILILVYIHTENSPVALIYCSSTHARELDTVCRAWVELQYINATGEFSVCMYVCM